METKINADQFQKSCFPQAGVLGNILDMHIYFFTAQNMFPCQLLPSGTPVGWAGVGQRRERLPGL